MLQTFMFSVHIYVVVYIFLLLSVQLRHLFEFLLFSIVDSASARAHRLCTYILILIWSLSCCPFLLSWVPETEINKLMISPFDFVCPLGGNRHTAGSHRLLGAFPGGCRWTAKLHRGAVLYGEDKRSDGVREAFVGGTSKWKNFFRDCFFPTTSRMVINNAGLNIMNKNYRLENWNFVFTTFKYANKHKSRKVICVVRTFTLKVVNLSN